VRHLINSAVLPHAGEYRYEILDESQAIAWLVQGNFRSTIGYPSTADHIERLSGIRPEVNRDRYTFTTGDEALVVRLKYRPGNPAAKGQIRPRPEDYEYGVLTRLS